MKLQNLAIIFLVITIPLIVILSYYLNMQQQTLKLQAEYDTKLAEATKEGIKAFEVNTVDWSEWVSEVNSQATRNNVQAVINTFITSLSNNLHLSGTAKEYMLNYIPAIAVTMYDGYYIYAPTYVPVTATNSNGVQMFYESGTANKITLSDAGEILYEADVDKGITGQTYTYTYTNEAMETEIQTFSNLTTNINEAKMEYRNILNNKIAYAARYRDTANKSRTNVVVNYTLDNRIYVYGKVNGEVVNKDGYLIYLESNILPRAYIPNAYLSNPKDSHIIVDHKITGLECDNTEIEPEILEEQVLCKEDSQYVIKTFKYIYDITHEKLYYDEIADNFFTIDSTTKEKNFISNSNNIKIGSEDCRYKSVSILWGDSDGTTEYKKVYQAINGKDKGKWCISIKPENAQTDKHKETIDTEIKSEKLKDLGLDDIRYSTIYRDFSAINYYVEAYAFTNWVKQNLGNRNLEIVQKKSNNTIENPIILSSNIFKISATNDPEDETSEIVQHKKGVMRDAVTTNLNLAISNYNGPGETIYKLPKLTDSDWEQLFSNISLITFFQGVPIGLKTYNNYAIATSTTNREYVDPGELYFSGDDINYHIVNCEKCGNEVYTGYRSVEYVQKEFLNGTDNIYYYQHNDNKNGTSRTACYYCAVNKSNYKQTSDKKIAYLQEKSYNEALARERYYQKQTLDGKIGITIFYHPTYEVGGEITAINDIPEPQDAEIGVAAEIQGKNPTPNITTNNKFIKYVFVGWTDVPNSTTVKYQAGEMATFYEDVDLYAVWRISLSELDWTRDFKWGKDTPSYWDGGDHEVYDGSISNIRITEATEGAKVEMTGNSQFEGKGATWATFKSEFISIQEFQFTYHVNKGDSFNAVGFMFNVIDQGSYLEGYMFSINFTGKPKEEAGDTGSIFKFRYNKNSNTKNIESLTRVGSAFHINVSSNRYSTTSGSMSIKVQENGYLVTGTEMTGSSFIPVDNPQPDTFGFMSDHYSHGCEQIGYYKIDNIKIIAVRNK